MRISFNQRNRCVYAGKEVVVVLPADICCLIIAATCDKNFMVVDVDSSQQRCAKYSCFSGPVIPSFVFVEKCFSCKISSVDHLPTIRS